jgi:competence protein ComGF
MVELLVSLSYIFIGLFIVYALVKIAVKHAISESSDTIQKIIINSINQNKNELNRNKDDKGD